MRHGRYEAHYRKWEEDGRDSPLRSKPTLRMEGVHAWEAWWQLNAARGAGFAGPEPLRWTEIEAVLRVKGLRGEDMEDAALLVRAMESGWLEEQAAGAGKAPAGKG